MLLYTLSRQLVPLFLVAAHHLKHLDAIQDPNLSKEMVQLDKVTYFPRDEVGSSATASTCTIAGSESQDAASLTTQSRIRKAVGSVWRKLSALIFGTRTELSAERKAQIHDHLEANRELINAMKIEYEQLLQSIKGLENQMSLQMRRRCEVSGSLNVSGVLRNLKNYHKKYTLKVIQNRLCGLAGIGARMSTIESVPPSWVWGFIWENKIAGVHPFVLSYLGRVKQILRDAEISKKLLSTRPIGMQGDKARLLGDESEGSSHSVHLEYKKRINQDLKRLSSKTMPKMNQSPTPPSILSGDPLRLVIEKVQISMVRDLRRILHSITFKTRERSPPHVWLFEDPLPRIKVGFEKWAGFQVLAFLHKFKLITEVEVNSFFESKETLELTARHLADLFNNDLNPFLAPHSLVPNINFITSDWHTGHLRYLKDLTKEKQAFLVYTILKWVSGDWIEKMTRLTEPTPEATDIFTFFGGKNLLQEIRNWSPKPWNKNTKRPQDDLIRQKLEAMFSLFKEFPNFTVGSNPVGEYRKLLEFMIVYYILDFVRTYGNENVQDFIKAHAQGDKNSSLLIGIYGENDSKVQMNGNFKFGEFEKQFNLIKYGLEAHLLTNQSCDYAYLLAYPKNLRHMLPEWITSKAQEDIKKKITKAKANFWYTYYQINEFSKGDSEMEKWKENGVVKIFLGVLTEVILKRKPIGYYNMWFYHVVDHSEIHPKNETESLKLALHLSEFYSLMDGCNDFSPDWTERLRSGLLNQLSENSSHE